VHPIEHHPNRRLGVRNDHAVNAHKSKR
jgi:hypothetical protein